MTMTRDGLIAMGEAAREACGCCYCQGGYEIGARTIATSYPFGMAPVEYGPPRRPSSCLAPTFLAWALEETKR
jgi:hypothetical protein